MTKAVSAPPVRRSKCPVCYRYIGPTRGRNIAGHFDKARRACPGSGIPFDTALVVYEPEEEHR